MQSDRPRRSDVYLAFPPMLTPHLVVDGSELLVRAAEMADAGDLSAGDVLVALHDERSRPGVSSTAIAIVLEPDVEVRRCRQIQPLMQVAIAESLGSLLPPKVAIEFDWPDSILINGGIAGSARLDMSTRQGSGIPDWLVVEAMLGHQRIDETEPGRESRRTTLANEGGEGLAPDAVAASIATHFLAWLYRWQADGFEAVSREWMFRCHGRTNGLAVPERAGRTYAIGLDDDVSLRWRHEDGEEGVSPWTLRRGRGCPQP